MSSSFPRNHPILKSILPDIQVEDLFTARYLNNNVLLLASTWNTYKVYLPYCLFLLTKSLISDALQSHVVELAGQTSVYSTPICYPQTSNEMKNETFIVIVERYDDSFMYITKFYCI